MPPMRINSSPWQLEILFGQAAEPILLLSPEGRIVAVNRAWEELTGSTAEQVVGRECRPHGPTSAGDLEGLAASFSPPPEALAGQPTASQTLIIRPGGDRVQRRLEFWPFHDRHGHLGGLLTVVRPVGSGSTTPDSAQQALRQALLGIRTHLHARYGHDVLVGQGAAHNRVLDGIEAAAGSTIPILITGEAGTGKRFVARLIHGQSPRRQMPLLPFDCRALPATILERELFGSPDPTRPLRDWGQLIAPEGSTVVLGDILQTPRDFQARLAAGLDGARRPVRLIATTAGNLDAALERATIHPDLYQVLTSLIIRLRPLRDRIDELPLLAQAMLERANLRGPTNRAGFDTAAIDRLLTYDWPGNLRELAGVIDEAHLSASGSMIEERDLPVRIRGELGGAYLSGPTPAASGRTLKEQMEAHERDLIRAALEKFHFHKTNAARSLGVNRPFLYRRIRELGIADLDPAAPGAAAVEPSSPTAGRPDADADERA